MAGRHVLRGVLDDGYLRHQLQEARWLLKGLESRADTLLRVVRCLVREQAAFLEFGAQALHPLTLRSVPLRMYAPGKLPAIKKPGGGGSSTVVDGITYVGCTTTRISQAGAAVNAARTYSQNARGYLAAGTAGGRYTTWFGAYASSRYGTASQHFVAIDNAIDQTGGKIKINCGCNQSYYAYVYPTRPYEIFVCRAFWSAPNTGTDSRAGTLIHEMSHFNAVAGTDDHVYGQSSARSLAISNPADALDNADNHEYFAENTPFQN